MAAAVTSLSSFAQQLHEPAAPSPADYMDHQTLNPHSNVDSDTDNPTTPVPASHLSTNTSQHHDTATATPSKSNKKSAKAAKRAAKKKGRKSGNNSPGSSPAPSRMADPMPDHPVEDERKEDTQDEQSDAFEDASETTPRPSSTGPGSAVKEDSTEAPNAEVSEETKPIDVTDMAEAEIKADENTDSTDKDLTKQTEGLKVDTDTTKEKEADDTTPQAVKAEESSSTNAPGLLSAEPENTDATSGRASPFKAFFGGGSSEAVSPGPSSPASERPPSAASSAPTQPGTFQRKASSGFAGLFGRIGRKAARSPPPKTDSASERERRSTVTSMRSNDSNATTSTTRPTLQEQFRTLRRQEEVNEGGDEQAQGDGDAVRSRSDTSGSRSSISHDGADSTVSTPAVTSPPALNPKLPPGTASGASAGPAEHPTPVDWDLWQQVVSDGPAAVNRTSGDDLNRAIASGIPPAIRGVVWQVLADSKNEELEGVYRSLKARGTDAEQKPAPRSRSPSRPGMSGAEKESVASSGSSVHSESSTAATSVVPSVDNSGTDLQSKLYAEKQKREAAALTKLEKAIKRDMGSRTSYSKYTQSAGLQDGLYGVCKAYALFDEGVGYAQGMNFIAMPLLFNMSEEEAFTLLVRLMGKYEVRGLFTADMAGLHMRLHQFERLLEDLEPALYCHLKRRNVSPHLYATQWYLTLFAYRFPLQLVLRVYDLILTEGLSAILKFGIALMQRNRDALLQLKDMGQITNFLKDKLFDVYIDKAPSASSLLDSGFFGSVTGGADKELYRADELVRDACSVPISEATLAEYAADWEETHSAERERVEQLDNLRNSNTSLQFRVKNLEDRTQTQDTEHVTIASDLIKLKLANEALTDENEVYKTKVAELQHMVDVQPGEVEARLKDEMERIMQRNIEVQNENRALREEMDEVESELVKVKMSHAQTQADHDTLRQKWSSVQALLNNAQ